MEHAQRGETLIYSLLVITQQALRLDTSCCKLATKSRFTLERLAELWKVTVTKLFNKFPDFLTQTFISVFIRKGTLDATLSHMN
jgi:hypothetical protein